MRTPEFEAALKAWKETEQEWEAFLEKLPIEEQKKAEELKERLEDFSSAQKKCAYIQDVGKLYFAFPCAVGRVIHDFIALCTFPRCKGRI